MARVVICIGCGEEKEHCAKGFCQKCYMRQYREPRRKQLAEYSKHYYEEHREDRIQFQREWRVRNREKHRAYSRCWAREHPEQVKKNKARYYQDNRERIKRSIKHWRKNNSEKVAAIQRRYRERHLLQIKSRIRQYQRDNREKINAKTRRYRARKASLPDTLIGEEARYKFAIGQCFYCSGEANLELDHFVALGAKSNSACGTTLANSVIACRKCNATKNAKLPSDILTQISLFGGV